MNADMSVNNFLNSSHSIGHNVVHNQQGETRTTTREIKTVEELRTYLQWHKIQPSTAPAHQLLQGGAPQNQHAVMQHVMDFATGKIEELNPLVAENISSAFPLTITEVSAPNKDYGPGENLLAKSAPGIVNFIFETVTIADGGWLTVRNSNVLFKCDTLILKGKPTGDWSDINILGVDAENAPPSGEAGPTGNLPQAKSASCIGLDPQAPDPGGVGATGTDGATGNHARPGLPSLAADFQIWKEIQSARGKLSVRSRSGAGGNGGTGQKGGKGGKGAQGGNGTNCGCNSNGGAVGGSGGKGGRGGKGGDGSDGVDGQGTISISVPEGWKDKVETYELVANFGEAGKRGEGGDGGAGGEGGEQGKNKTKGNTGGTLGSGGQGDLGNAGKKQGIPAKIEVRSI